MPNLSQRTGVGASELFVTTNSDRQNSSTLDRDDLELIDIDSLFDEEADDKPVLSQDEAWELFS